VADGVGHGSVSSAHHGCRLVVTSPGRFRRRRRVVGV
jgi:hypothetical protein